MKRTPFKQSQKPLKRNTPLNRGTSTLKRTPLARGTSTLKQTPLARGNSTLKQTGFKPKVQVEGEFRYSTLNNVSPRQKIRNAKYYKKKAEYMALHPTCEFKGCNKPATDFHHKAKRIGENMFRHGMAACREHHDYIGTHTRWAREEGYLIDVSGRD